MHFFLLCINKGRNIFHIYVFTPFKLPSLEIHSVETQNFSMYKREIGTTFSYCFDKIWYKYKPIPLKHLLGEVQNQYRSKGLNILHILRAIEGGTKPDTMNCFVEAGWDTFFLMEPMVFLCTQPLL